MQAAAPACACTSDRLARTDAWRDLCQRYYFHQDARAKRVLDHFEACKLDELVIDAADEEEDAEFARLVAFLGLRKCAQSEHAQAFAANFEELERVKNHVRSEYHVFRSASQYQDFDARVREVQSTAYELQMDARDGRDRLVLRAQEADYVRSSSNQARMEKDAEAFVTTHRSNVGAHPFLAGLAQVLHWNLESSTVVGWQLFVESGGPAFSSAALSFLVGVLNFGHVTLPPTAPVAVAHAAPPDGSSPPPHVQSRLWLLDAYMSDHDIRQLLRLLPSPRKLGGRPTGTKHTSDIFRMNTHGTHDEHRRFFERWCVLL